MKDCDAAETEEDITAADGKVQAIIEELKVANDAQDSKLTEDLYEVEAKIKEHDANDAKTVKLTKELHETQWRRLVRDCNEAKTKEDIEAADDKLLAEILDLEDANGANSAQAVKLFNELHEIKQRRNGTKREVAEGTSIPHPRALSGAPPSHYLAACHTCYRPFMSCSLPGSREVAKPTLSSSSASAFPTQKTHTVCC